MAWHDIHVIQQVELNADALKTFSYPSLLSSPSVVDPSLHALLKQPDWTDILTNEHFWSHSF